MTALGSRVREARARRAERRALRRRPRADSRPRPALEAAFWAALLLGALALVVARQTEGVERERALREVEEALAAARAERVETVERIQRLRSRERIVPVAQGRLGMHLPGDAEVILVPLPTDAETAR